MMKGGAGDSCRVELSRGGALRVNNRGWRIVTSHDSNQLDWLSRMAILKACGSLDWTTRAAGRAKYADDDGEYWMVACSWETWGIVLACYGAPWGG